MKRLLLFLALAGTVFGQSNIRYDNYTHAVQKPPTSAGSIYDYDFSALNISGIAAVPGGSDGQFQYNNAGALAGTVSLTISSGIISTNASKFVIYDNASSSNNFKFNTSNLTGSRTVKLPDGNSTTVLPDSGAAHNFLNAIDINGNITKAQPTGSDIGSGGTINSTTFADTNTYRAKDGTNWRMGNASDSTKLMQWDLSNIATGTSRTATMPDGNATLVMADTGASNNFLNAISATGVITKARPTISNLTPLSGTSLLIGSNAGVSSVNEITLGSGISMTGSTLSATGSGGNVSNSGTPTSGQVALWTDATHIQGSSTIDSPTFTTGVILSSAPLTLSGNISSAAWTTGGLRIKGNPATLTDTTSSGTVSAAFTNVLGGNTIAATSATTFTDYVTLYARDPVAGSNVTLTNKWALGGESLRIGTSNPLKVSNSGVLTLSAAAVLGTPASGDFSSGSFTWPTFNQNTTGSAAKWTTARTLALTGDVTYTSGSFDGSGNATGVATLANIPAISGTNLTGTGASFTAGNATKLTTGRTISATGDVTYTSGSFDGSGNVTGTATLANIPTIAGTNLTGTGASFTAGNATKLTTGRTIALTGDVTYTSGSFDGSGNVTGTATLANIPAIAGTNLTGTGASFTAGNATKWTTGRTVSTTGDVTYTSGSLDGSGNVTGTATVANVPVAATHATDNTTIPTDTGGWTEYFVTTTDFTTTNTGASLTDITGLVTGTLTNSAWYEFEFVIRLLNGADANGMKIGIHGAGTGTAASVFGIITSNTSATASANSIAIGAVDTATIALVTYSSGEGVVMGKGFFKATSTGTSTMSLQLVKVTGNTATCRVGSVLRVRKAHT